MLPDLGMPAKPDLEQAMAEHILAQAGLIRDIREGATLKRTIIPVAK